MTGQTPPKQENRENDFMDMSVGTALSIAFFMGIFLVGLIAELVLG